MIKTPFLLLVLASSQILADPPGVSYSPQLRKKLNDDLQSQAGDYQPRTRHLDQAGQPLYINRLISQDSPYLLQ